MMSMVRQALWATRVETVVEKYFNTEDLEENKILHVLSVKGLGEAVTQFVDKDDKDAINDVVSVQIARTIQYLKEHNVNDNNILEDLENFRLMRSANPDDEANEARQTLASASRSQRRSTTKNGDDSLILVDSINSDSDDDYVGAAKPAPRGRGSRGGRGSRAQNAEPKPKPAPRGRGRGRGAKDTKEVQPTLADAFRFTTTRKAPARHPQMNKGAVYEISDSD